MSGTTVMLPRMSSWGQTNMVVLPDTDPVVAYIDEDQDNKVSVIRLKEDVGWAYVAAGLTRGPGSGLSLALSQDNTPVLAFWQPSEQAGYDLCTLEFPQLRYSNRSQPQPACLRTSTTRDSFVSLAFGPDGLKYLAYVEEDDRLRVVKQLVSGEWVLLGATSQVPLVPRCPTCTSAGDATQISLAVSNEGKRIVHSCVFVQI